MLRVKINGTHSYDIKELDEGIELNGQVFSPDFVKLEDGLFHLLIDGVGYKVEVLKQDDEHKTLELRVNGNSYHLELADRYDLLLEEMGMSDMATVKITDLKAPMPGLVLDIKVSEGQSIKKGDALLVLEAMKMENIIKASADVTVGKVVAQKGDVVEKGQILIHFSEA